MSQTFSLKIVRAHLINSRSGLRRYFPFGREVPPKLSWAKLRRKDKVQKEKVQQTAPAIYEMGSSSFLSLIAAMAVSFEANAAEHLCNQSADGNPSVTTSEAEDKVLVLLNGSQSETAHQMKLMVNQLRNLAHSRMQEVESDRSSQVNGRHRFEFAADTDFGTIELRVDTIQTPTHDYWIANLEILADVTRASMGDRISSTLKRRNVRAITGERVRTQFVKALLTATREIAGDLGKLSPGVLKASRLAELNVVDSPYLRDKNLHGRQQSYFLQAGDVNNMPMLAVLVRVTDIMTKGLKRKGQRDLPDQIQDQPTELLPQIPFF